MNLYDNKEDLKTIIINTSEKLGLMEAIIEKDFYSMMFLKRIIKYDNNIKWFRMLPRMVNHLNNLRFRVI